MLVEGVFGRTENGCPISSWVEEMVQFLSVYVFGSQYPCQESHNCLVLQPQGSDVALLGSTASVCMFIFIHTDGQTQVLKETGLTESIFS